jgi:carboxymethylenebutenolidase
VIELETRSRMTFGVPVMVSRPLVDHALPAVIVLHEAWGLTPDIADAAERVAAAGFLTVTPDLQSGPASVLSTLREIRRGDGPVLDVLCRIADLTLAMPDSAGTIGVLGFSMGGAMALLLDRHPGVGAIAANYCMVPPAALGSRPLPVVGSFGSRDRMLPSGTRPLLQRLAVVGVHDHDVRSYPDAGHSFMTEIGRRREEGIVGRVLGLAHHRDAAEHAWDRTLRFLGDRLS